MPFVMIQRTLYLETPIWNQLSSDNVDADALFETLLSSDVVPVISTQLISELAASFHSKRSSNPSRLGQRLFAYLLKYVLKGIPCLKMNCQLLQDEAMTITGEIDRFDMALSGSDYERMTSEVEKLARGELDAPVQSFLENRRRLWKNSRAEAAQYGRDRSFFKPVCEASFGAFLESANPIEILKVLREHLQKEFPDTTLGTLAEVAAALLRNPTYRVANTMVRADLYTSWRAIRAGTLSRDVLDDCYHLVNASYCDIYATKDFQQSEYAPIVLGSTDVFYFDGITPVSEWLAGIAARN